MQKFMVSFHNKEKRILKNSQMTFLSLFLSLIKDSSWGMIQIYEIFRYFDEKEWNSHTLSFLAQYNYWLWKQIAAAWIQMHCLAFGVCLDNFAF